MRSLRTTLPILVLAIAAGCSTPGTLPSSEPGRPVQTETASPPLEPSPEPTPTETPLPEATAAIPLLPAFVPEFASSRTGKGALSSLTASGDSIIIGSSSGICIYRAADMAETWCARTLAPVQSLAVSQGGDRLAVGLNQGGLLLWDLDTRSILAERKVGLYEGPSFMEFSPDGAHLAVISPGKLSLWNGETLADPDVLSPSASYFAPVRFSPDGRYLAWIDHPTSEHFAHIYDLIDRETHDLVALPLWAHTLDWSPDGDTLWIGQSGDIGCYEHCTPSYKTEGGLLAYAPASGLQGTYTLEPEDRAVWASAVNRDGDRLALHIGAYFPRLLVFSTGAGTAQAAPLDPHPYIRLVAWDGSGEALLFLDAGMRLRRWLPGSASALDITPDGYAPISWVQALSPDGSALARFAAASTGAITIWSIPDGEILAEIPTEDTVSVGWDPEGRRLAFASYLELFVYDLATGERLSLFTLEPDSGTSLDTLAWTPDGARLLVGMVHYDEESSFDRVVVLDALDGAVLAEIFDAGLRFALAPSGERVAVHRWDDSGPTAALSIWDTRSGLPAGKIALSFGLYHFSWAPDSASLAAFQDWSLVRLDLDGTLRWSRSLGALHMETLGVNIVVFSPDGSLIATAGREIALWDSATGELIRIFEGHASLVRDLVFSPEGDRVISASEDGTVIVWAIP